MYLLFCFMANILEGKISPLVFSSSWSLILFSTWVGLESILSCSPRGSSVHGILQARKLAWVAVSFSRDLPDPGTEPGPPALHADSTLSREGNLTLPDWASAVSSGQPLSRVRLCNPVDCSTPGLPVHHQLPEFTPTCAH